MRAGFINDPCSPYTILGVHPDISDAELKLRHRALVREHHPDRLAATGVPPELRCAANRRLAAINAAYDEIVADRRSRGRAMIFKPDSPLVHALHPSCNTGDRRKGCRADMIVLHYTGMSSADQAVKWLADPCSKVSCHYVIDEAGHITQMVAETQRAWHAGASHWAGETDINSASIGIEIQNPGHEHGYPDFPPEQMQAIAALCRDIAQRRGVPPERVLAHSDVAPGRKIDPGEKFDWAFLAKQGVGHWVTPAPLDPEAKYVLDGDAQAAVAETMELLRAYGYGIDNPGRDDWFAVLVRTFQLHFRPARADGRLDAGTLDTLRRLVAALPAHATS